ncbi:phage holin family protein [Patescibacteria group bacterium]|nr:MAG: phage holin family protein [Patescibacteria group bacterium]
MGLLTRFLGTVFAVLLVIQFVEGFHTDTYYIAGIAAVVLGLLSVTVKPVLSLITLPLNIVTLGLFSLVINAGLILLVAHFLEGFTVDGFIPALLGGAVVAVIGWLIVHILKKR